MQSKRMLVNLIDGISDMRLTLKYNGGFTLFELLGVLSIISLLAVVGSVNLMQVMNDHTLMSVRDRFSHAVHFARAEAIYSQQFVTICPSSDQYGCGDDWSNGWIIFVDDDGSGLRENEQERLINTVSGEAAVVMNGNNEQHIMFNPSGRHLGGSQYFDICLSDYHPRQSSRRIKLTSAGSLFYPVSSAGEHCNA